jgi:GTPase SAR1 family protein
MTDINSTIIKKAHIIILIFDLKNRDSFDELTIWVNYLRDICLINKTIYIFGNFKPEKNILTTKVDIDDMIEKQQISARYLEIGNRTKEDLENLTDEILEITYVEDKTQNLDESNLSKCILF